MNYTLDYAAAFKSTQPVKIEHVPNPQYNLYNPQDLKNVCQEVFMSKRIAITVFSSLLLSQTGGFCADVLMDTDTRRDDLLKQITKELVAGKITPGDAIMLKNELDNVVKLETVAQEDKQVTPEELSSINNALELTKTHTTAATHSNKIWLGINYKDRTLENKITNALDSHKISQEQATSLMGEEEKLRARENNGDPSNEFDFTDAITIAGDIQSLAGKIDQLASAGHTE